MRAVRVDIDRYVRGYAHFGGGRVAGEFQQGEGRGRTAWPYRYMYGVLLLIAYMIFKRFQVYQMGIELITSKVFNAIKRICALTFGELQWRAQRWRCDTNGGLAYGP